MARAFLFFFFFVFATVFSSGDDTNTRTRPKFSAVLYFGDSTLDTGNNAYIPTLASSNHSPYGRDFAGSAATGRFSNGLLVPDILCSRLGIKQLSPPFLDPDLSDDDVRTGVNFASAGSGLDDATSALLNTMPISKQSELLKAYLARLEGVAGEEEAHRIVGDALVLVSAGTNDFLFNYYDLPRKSSAVAMDEYQDFLLQNLHTFLQSAYEVGGRKFLISGLPPIGCIPLQMTLSGFDHSVLRTCVEEQNMDARNYNSKLKELLPELRDSLPGSRFVYFDLYGVLMEIIDNAAEYGFEEAKRGCCGTGLIEEGPLCNHLSPVCPDASRFVFFDAVHPSQRVYEVLTGYIMENNIPLL